MCCGAGRGNPGLKRLGAWPGPSLVQSSSKQGRSGGGGCGPSVMAAGHPVDAAGVSALEAAIGGRPRLGQAALGALGVKLRMAQQ